MESVPTPVPEPEPVPADTARTRCLAIRADWSEALAEEHIPATYLLYIGDSLYVAGSHSIYMYQDSVHAGPYSVRACNVAEGITIADSIASIRRTEDGLMIPSPDYLFAAGAVAEVAAGDTALVSLSMRRLLTPVTLTLHFTVPIEVTGVEATLSGLVSAVRLPDGTPADSAVIRSASGGTARLGWESLPDGKGIRMYLRTFGIVPGQQQVLTVSVTLSDGRTLTFTSDLTGELDDLDNLVPVVLENTLDTAEPEVPAGTEGGIQDWLPGNGEGESGDAY